MKYSLYILMLGLTACQVQPTVNEADIEAELLSILDSQDLAWSSGDIDAFMESYWKSPELRFASGGTIQRGWEGTKARYEARYPDASIMGTLVTGNHEIDVLSDKAAIVHGSWRLERDGAPASGLYTLLFKNIDGDWVIVSDTTTSAQ